eukprot:TCONS_00040925-protein
MTHFQRFWMEVHSGPPDSKSVVLFCCKPPCLYEDPSTFDQVDLSNIEFGNRFIPIVQEFTYLGSFISCDSSDNLDVDRRIQKASNAFGMIRNSLFSSSKINVRVKANVYQTFILPILLFFATESHVTSFSTNKI